MNNLEPEEAPSLWDVFAIAIKILPFMDKSTTAFQLKLLTFIGEKFGT